jgi:hypothetical protein
MRRIGKFIDRKWIRVDRCWGEKNGEGLIATGFLFGVMKMF